MSTTGSTTGSTTRGSRLGGRAACAVTAAMALVLGGCGGSQEEPAAPTEDTVATSSPETVAGTTDAVPPTGTATSVPDEAAGTSAPASGEEDEPTDTAGADEPTDAPEPDAADYPAESIAYAREFLRAWSALDDARIARLAVEEVTHGTDSWGVWETQDRLTSCPLDPLSLPEQGVDDDGLDLVIVEAPDQNPVWIVLRRDALGGERAVVGVDHRLTAGAASSLGRSETPLDAYARSFVEAWTAEDLGTMSRLGDEDLAEDRLRNRPVDESPAPTWNGFLAFEGDPLSLLVDLPTTDEDVPPFTVVLDLDVALAEAGEPHAVVDADFIIDPRYFCADQDSVVTEPAPTG